MNDCIFCKIIAKSVPAEIVAENDELIVFKDIKPSAPIHWLIVPKKHTTNPHDTDQETIGKMVKMATKVAEDGDIEKSGYRLVINVGEGGGQIVRHIHLHLLSGLVNLPEMGGGDRVVSQ